MVYDTTNDLPESVRSTLPKHAQEIYKSAYNSAHESHKNETGTEAAAHRIAWAAVKQKYHKEDNAWQKGT